MYAEVKNALYRYVPIVMMLGTAGPKQAFNIGRRAVNFIGTDLLQELACCRTVILKDAFRDSYKCKKRDQVAEEIHAFLTWWQSHVQTNYYARLEVPLGLYGIAPVGDLDNTLFGEESDMLDRIDDWLPSLSVAARKNITFRLRLQTCWNGTYRLDDNVKRFWKRHRDMVRSNVKYSIATAATATATPPRPINTFLPLPAMVSIAGTNYE